MSDRARNGEGRTATNDGSPFHEGEQRIQARLGVRDGIEPWARRVVRPYLPDEHRDFYGQLPFLVLAARDAAGRPWATLLAGEPGFVTSSDPQTLDMAAVPSRGDALADALASGDDVGLLGIELHTRRRNRVNGRVAERASGGLVLSVEQAFGNCPQHITERNTRRAEGHEGGGAVRRGDRLTGAQREWIARADTFFIATGHRGEGESATFGMDASHRGGPPGFVHVTGDAEIVFPDYAGNNHFNTLGNLELDPRAGFLFVDFERGHMLQLTGQVRIDWDSAEVARHPGAQRLVSFAIEEVVELEHALPIRWETARGSVRTLRLIEKKPESNDVTSFVFASRDGGPLPPFAAGQHLPIEIDVPGQSAPARRTYSLSGSPADPSYRISVKRDPLGLVSRHLHDELEVGDAITAAAPSGTFVLDEASDRPVVLVSAGVGLTPLVSMLHARVADALDHRPVWFVHGARDGAHHALWREVEVLARQRSHVGLHVAYSRPRPQDELGRHHHGVGRVDAELLEKLVPGLEADFYLCGPIGFMAGVEAALESRAVPRDRIHSESFGPAGGG